MDTETKSIKTALVSVFDKNGLEPIIQLLANNGVKLLSTGGTRDYIKNLGFQCDAVEDLTGYPSILGGRVKTLHPKVFGGILARRDNDEDARQTRQFEIPEIDLVIVDLYPFEATVANPDASHADIIEKIDIGGISLIRAAAKNHRDVVIVASKAQYAPLEKILREQGPQTTLEQRTDFALRAFQVSSHYDSAISSFFADVVGDQPSFAMKVDGAMPLRYGENPHQKASFFGAFDALFDKLHGKEISYNNLLDIDAATALIAEFPDSEPAVAILKHNNPCGVAVAPTLEEAWATALACDPVSAFGGIIATNTPVNAVVAEEINKIFFEVIIAPAFSDEALAVLKQKKNRIILVKKENIDRRRSVRSCLNGVLVQDVDLAQAQSSDLVPMTKILPTPDQVDDLLFANILVKHCKSNAIVLAKDRRLLAAGVGQTSRIDSLKQAIDKAHSFGFDLNGAVMASDAFFPFADCVQTAAEAGVKAVIQPGGSLRDNESVEWCDNNGVAMVKTGIRHFRH